MSKRDAIKHEKELARRIGGRVTPASGATDGHKGDIAVGGMLIDDKSTINKSISVTRDMLIKISREAREAGKDPVLSLSFVGIKNMGLAGQTWYCIPEYLFREKVLES